MLVWFQWWSQTVMPMKDSINLLYPKYFRLYWIKLAPILFLLNLSKDVSCDWCTFVFPYNFPYVNAYSFWNSFPVKCSSYSASAMICANKCFRTCCHTSFSFGSNVVTVWWVVAWQNLTREEHVAIILSNQNFGDESCNIWAAAGHCSEHSSKNLLILLDGQAWLGERKTNGTQEVQEFRWLHINPT